VLDLAILGLLKERAMHGYELKRLLGQRLGFFWTVSFGSLYPTLRKLESAGFVERVPDTDARSRRRQVFRITDGGEAQFLELIGQGSASAWEEDKFPLRFAFFRYLPTETRVWLLERRRDYLEDKLEEGRGGLARARRTRADPYTISLMRHGVEQTEHDLRWIDELLASESTDPPTDGEPRPPTTGPTPEPPMRVTAPSTPAHDAPDPDALVTEPYTASRDARNPNALVSERRPKESTR
jgi:DNA-binding PadR family transcriptional regulator